MQNSEKNNKEEKRKSDLGDFSVTELETKKIDNMKKKTKEKNYEGFFYKKIDKIPSKEAIIKAETYIKSSNKEMKFKKNHIEKGFVVVKNV